MTFLPVVERELRVASRRRATHWMRFFAALLVIGVGFILLIGSGHNVPAHRLAKVLFQATSLIGFGFCALAGTFLTADCLCSERREGTLGLLFLTDLRGYDVVLGKLVATSAVAVYALLAILPMLGLPLLMGGVTPGEFGRMCLALIVILLLSLASGMLVSALSHDTRAAMLGSFSIMLALTGGIFLAGWGIWTATRLNPLDTFMMFSPVGAYAYSFDAGPTGVSRFWMSVWILGGLALAQLAAASVLLLIRFLVPGRMSIASSEIGTFALIFLGAIPLLYGDFRALGWIGMRLGLRGQRHHRAVLGTLLRVLIPPWVTIFLFVFLSMQGGASRDAVTAFFVVWAIASLVMAVVQANSSKSALTAQFRRLAAGDALREPDPPWTAEP